MQVSLDREELSRATHIRTLCSPKGAQLEMSGAASSSPRSMGGSADIPDFSNPRTHDWTTVPRRTHVSGWGRRRPALPDVGPDYLVPGLVATRSHRSRLDLARHSDGQGFQSQPGGLRFFIPEVGAFRLLERRRSTSRGTPRRTGAGGAALAVLTYSSRLRATCRTAPQCHLRRPSWRLASRVLTSSKRRCRFQGSMAMWLEKVLSKAM
jgi:hypothetical protein